ncbi:radical SAM protein [bacterium]|nr:radical SAM protein [bacterium]
MYTYGPIPSRRLGRSLGVSLIPPKTCSFDCVFCQLGKTTRMKTEKKSYYSKTTVLQEIERRMQSEEVDTITFGGDGEPCLSSDLEWLIARCRHQFRKPVAVFTNGSFLSSKAELQALAKADIVISRLNSGNPQLFHQIHRPLRAISFDQRIENMIDFRWKYEGQFWLEVMILPGLNDTDKALMEIRKIMNSLAPDKLFITTPNRPGTDLSIKPASTETLLHAQEILGRSEILDDRDMGGVQVRSYADAKTAIREITQRFPLKVEEAVAIETGYTQSGSIAALIDEGLIREIEYGDEIFLTTGEFQDVLV